MQLRNCELFFRKGKPLFHNQTINEIHRLVHDYTKEHLTPRFDEKNPILRLHEPTFGGDEICAALDQLMSGRVTMGEKVFGLEREFSEKFGSRESVLSNSGSSANLLAVAALSNPACKNGSWKPGDEIIVPALCWSTTVWPLVQHNLIPVIVDIDPGTFNIDPKEIEKAITPRTRGIKLVHVYGNSCDMDEIMRIVKKHNLILLEDSCESLGTTYKGKKIGTFGRVGTFSFYFSHHMTTLEGGVCVTDDEEFSDLMGILRAHGWIRQSKYRDRYIAQYPDIDPRFIFVNQGYNLRVTEVQAAMGSVQLRKLDDFIRRRQETARFWLDAMSEFKKYFDFQNTTPDSEHTWFGFSFVLKNDVSFTVKEITQFLNHKGIETRPIIAGNIAAQPAMKYFEHRVEGSLNRSNHIMRNAFSIGCHQDVTLGAQKWVVEMIREFIMSHK